MMDKETSKMVKEYLDNNYKDSFIFEVNHEHGTTTFEAEFDDDTLDITEANDSCCSYNIECVELPKETIRPFYEWLGLRLNKTIEPEKLYKLIKEYTPFVRYVNFGLNKINIYSEEGKHIPQELIDALDDSLNKKGLTILSVKGSVDVDNDQEIIIHLGKFKEEEKVTLGRSECTGCKRLFQAGEAIYFGWLCKKCMDDEND